MGHVTDAPRHLAIVGGGITGLAAAHRLLRAAPQGSIRVTVLEAADRFGGWIRTEPFAGRPVDFGPDSLLVRTPWAAELCRELGIEDELVAPGSGGAFILSGGKLRRLPTGILAGLPNGPMPFVRSGLLGPLGIARAGLDLVLPANAPPGDESIGDLIRRRLGAQALERVIDPLLGGVHAGRCDDLSLAATAPQIAAAATADRSLLRGLRKTAPPRPAPGAPARPVFMGPRAGMQRIVDALVDALGTQAELRLGTAVDAIEPIESRERGAADGPGPRAGLRLHLGRGAGDAAESLDVDGVILAVPAGTAAALLRPHAPGAADTLGALKYASVAQTALAYDRADLSALPAGTGFLVPRPEGTVMTACTFLDQKWPERRAALMDSAAPPRPAGTQASPSGATGQEAPELRDALVLKCSAGRIEDDRVAHLTDDDLVATLHRELARVIPGLPATARPLAHRVFRVRQGLPQYEPGHPARIEAALAEVAGALPGLTLAGAAYRGTSVPMCIRDGRAGADAQLARLLPAA